jgi:hypothetical protein
MECKNEGVSFVDMFMSGRGYKCIVKIEGIAKTAKKQIITSINDVKER